MIRMRCCADDGGRPSGIALQGEISNHRKLLRLRVVVVSVAWYRQSSRYPAVSMLRTSRRNRLSWIPAASAESMT